MNERWVCKRCFADNDESNSACLRCGLTRGAESTEDDRATWAQVASTEPAKPAGWQQWLRYWWVPALAVVLVIGYLASARRDGSGAITDGGTMHIEDLQVQDCFDFEDAEEISEVDARPCTEAHGYELFHIATFTGPDAYPTEDQWVNFIFDACAPAFEAYVGRTYESSALDFVPFTPTEEGWDDGDRVVQCALVDPADAQLTTTLRNADR